MKHAGLAAAATTALRRRSGLEHSGEVEVRIGVVYVAKQLMRHRASQPKRGDRSPDGLVPWRRRLLQSAGFDAPLSEKLASDRGFDLHAVLELIDRGCPPKVAARILAPLDDQTEGSR
jgi:hypothetical protein